MHGYFVTGTDTDIGKTVISLGLIAALQARGLRVAAMKPVAAGCAETANGLRNDDALALLGQADGTASYGLVNPYAFAPPIAPHIAAAQAGDTIELAPLRAACAALAADADRVVVEGVGGWRVPLNDRDTVADLAAVLGLPVILVVGIRLGCLNHALLTARDIAALGLPLAGWVANRMDPDCREAEANIAALRARLPSPLLGVVPFFPARPAAGAVAACLDLGALG